MNKGLLIGITLLLVVAICVAGYFLLTMPQGTSPSSTNSVVPELTQASDSNVHTIIVEGSEFKFSPSDMTVTAGSKVKVIFKNTGEMKHDWIIEGLGIATPVIEPGESTTVEFTIDTPGEYVVFCSVGFHRSQGMVGKLIVK